MAERCHVCSNLLSVKAKLSKPDLAGLQQWEYTCPDCGFVTNEDLAKLVGLKEQKDG